MANTELENRRKEVILQSELPFRNSHGKWGEGGTALMIFGPRNKSKAYRTRMLRVQPFIIYPVSAKMTCVMCMHVEYRFYQLQ